MAVLCLVGASSALAEDALTVGFDAGYPPFSYLDEQGRPAGFVVDVMRELAAVMDLEIAFQADEWAVVRELLERGEIDVMAGMYHSRDREALVDFSQPFMTISFTAFKLAAPDVTSLDALDAKRVIVQREDILHDYVRSQDIEPLITPVDSPGAALTLLATGEYDYALLSRLQGLYAIHQMDLREITPTSATFLKRGYCLAVPEGRTELLFKLDEGLAILHATNAFDDIYARWFGSMRPPGHVLRTVLLVAGPIFLLLLFASFLLWLLRRQIRQRTRQLQDELSERKRAEAALRESERRYRLLVENAIDMIYECDLEGRCIFANPVATRAVGYPHSELIGKYFLDLVAPSFQEEVLQRHEHQLRDRAPSIYEEFLAQRKDGSTFWVAQNVQLVLEGDVPRAHQAVARDIDQQRKAEAAVRHSEARYRALFARVPVAIGELDYSSMSHWQPKDFEQAADYLARLADRDSVSPKTIGRFVLLKNANDTAVQMFKARDAAHLREQFSTIFNRDSYITLARELPRIWAGEHLLEVELPATAFDGAPLDLTVRQYVPQVGGKSDLANVVMAVTDITERKATEHTLKHYAAQLRLFHAIDQAVLQAQSVEAVADAALDGISPLIPYDRASLALFDDEAQRVELVALRSQGASVAEGEFSMTYSEFGVSASLLAGEHVRRRISADDTACLVERQLAQEGIAHAMNVPLVIDQEVAGAMNFGISSEADFTEGQVKTAKDTAVILATALRHLRLYEQTRQDAETMSVLLQEVNHRVKNNLAAIIGMLYVEQRHLDPEEQQIYKPFLDELIRRVRGLSAVHELLSETQWQPLPLSRLCNQVIHATLYGLPPHKEISIRINPSTIFVTSDVAHHLALVLNELTTNTIKHAMRNRERAIISVMSYAENGHLHLVYEDDGPGFPTTMLQDRAEHFHVGYGLIQNIAEKILGGKLILKNNGGAQTNLVIRAQAEESMHAVAQ